MHVDYTPITAQFELLIKRTKKILSFTNTTTHSHTVHPPVLSTFIM